MTTRWTAAILLALLLGVADGAAGATVRRYALIAGANEGSGDRPTLRFAVSDAERFAAVLRELGGVDERDAIVLEQPGVGTLEKALETLRERTEAVRREGSRAPRRTEFVFYYSGHADERGLLLGDDRYSYRTLRDRIDAVPADVRIVVLDACASGAITRLKGGRRSPAFLADESSEMRGHAFLTSSSADEAAQESEGIGGSFFTHYLLSGLRGAADVSGEGKVTLNEAYQFAFHETLGRTAETRGGAQHPAYDIQLSGTGDVVMTDLRQASAGLVLAQDLDGRFYVHNDREELVAELFKARGRRVELRLAPGTYEVRCERPGEAFLARAEVKEGATVVLEGTQMDPTTPEPTLRRGGPAPPRYAVSGRNRLEVRFGMWRTGEPSPPAGTVIEGVVGEDQYSGGAYARHLREDLALTLSVDNVTLEAGRSTSPTESFTGARTLTAVFAGVRWNPFADRVTPRAVKPYLAASLGPVIGESAGISSVAGGGVGSNKTLVTPGGHIGAGVDVHFGRSWGLSWSFGLSGGYNWMVDFSEPVRWDDNYSGFRLGVHVACSFGKAHTLPR
jgi:hypothetical protein